MSPASFQEIARVSRLAIIQSLFASVVQDELDSMPQLEAVHLSGVVVGDSLALSLSYIGPNGVQLGEVAF